MTKPIEISRNRRGNGQGDSNDTGAPPPAGQLLPFVFDNTPVRGKLLRIDDLTGHIPSLHRGDTLIGRCLGEMLAASATMMSDLKTSGDVTIQLHSPSDVSLLVARCGADGHLKAYAAGQATTGMTFADIAADGSALAVNVETDGHGGPVYQSIVGLNATSVGSSMEQYFNDSVQLPTYFKVVTGVGASGALSCGALFLQAMPQADVDGTHADDWRRLGILLATVQPEEILPGQLRAEAVLLKLFAEDELRTFPRQPLVFAADNPRARMENALRSLGAATCREMLDEGGGKVEMTDEFSGQTEVFDAADLAAVFGDAWGDGQG